MLAIGLYGAVAVMPSLAKRSPVLVFPVGSTCSAFLVARK